MCVCECECVCVSVCERETPHAEWAGEMLAPAPFPEPSPTLLENLLLWREGLPMFCLLLQVDVGQIANTLFLGPKGGPEESSNWS